MVVVSMIMTGGGQKYINIIFFGDQCICGQDMKGMSSSSSGSCGQQSANKNNLRI